MSFDRKVMKQGRTVMA